MIKDFAHIAGGVLGLVLTEIPDIIGDGLARLLEPQIGSVFFTDVVLEQPKPH